ncbi:MAG: sortase [Clostridia bacterium]|nr:sortase [Clostridia bacterium]
MKNKISKIICITGIILITFAVCLLIKDIHIENKSNQTMEEELEKYKNVLNQKDDAVQENGSIATEIIDMFNEIVEESYSDSGAYTELAESIEGPKESTITAYYGILSIDDLQLETLIQFESKTDIYPKLKVSPMIAYHEEETDRMVICGHNFKKHFGPLHDAKIESTVKLKTFSGEENQYNIEKVETISPYSVDEVMYSEYDLVLYTCISNGQKRIAVYCQKQEV